MKSIIAVACVALPLLLTSCATPPPRPLQTYYKTDPSALVIKSLDSDRGQLLFPAASVTERKDGLLAKARAFPQRQTAVVILENYTDPQIGAQFRDRGTDWVMSLRSLGYQHIVFLQGNGTAADGLPLLARYD